MLQNQSQSCTVSAASTSLGVTTISFTGSDPNASNSPQTAAATLTVLDHAAAAFTNSSTVLTLSFGTVHLGSGTQDLQYQIENLPAAYRAGLALESVMALSDPDGLFSTDATPFSDLAPGTTTGLLDLFLNPSQLGNFAGQYQFTLSDEQDLSGWTGGQTLTLNVTAEVVPEPLTFALLAASAIGLVSLRLEQTETDGQRHYHLRNDLVRRRGRRGHRFQSSHERRKSRDTAHIQRQPLRKGQVWGRPGSARVVAPPACGPIGSTSSEMFRDDGRDPLQVGPRPQHSQLRHVRRRGTALQHPPHAGCKDFGPDDQSAEGILPRADRRVVDARPHELDVAAARGGRIGAELAQHPLVADPVQHCAATTRCRA